MSFSQRFEQIFKSVLPSPLTISVLLTLITMVIAFFYSGHEEGSGGVLTILNYWEKGVWDPPMIVFMVQMMLILVLGHILALSPPAEKAIALLTAQATSPAKAAWLVTFSAIVVALFNWGLGLIFGAIIARKTAEKFSRNRKPLNYGLIAAAGYSGLMVWHGGLSGSAPLKAAEIGHIQNMMSGIIPESQLSALPEFISLDHTIFGGMNIVTSLALLILLPLIMAFIAGKTSGKVPSPKGFHLSSPDVTPVYGAEKLDYSKLLCMGFALIIIAYQIWLPFSTEELNLHFITPNYINLSLLALGLLFHGSFARFSRALDKAISGASGILIQFPIYFGIMGIMKYSGLVEGISSFFISVSNGLTFPIFTFFSAGLVNIFVPSGGGQWSIQGPILIQAARELNISIPKSIMAMAYGDQLTNMLQPFWALPLLAITGLKAREIIPYTLILLIAGLLIFIPALIIF